MNLFSRVKGASRQTDKWTDTEDTNLFSRVKGASRLTDSRCQPLQQGIGSKQTDRQTNSQTADANLFSRVKGASRQTDKQPDSRCQPLQQGKGSPLADLRPWRFRRWQSLPSALSIRPPWLPQLQDTNSKVCLGKREREAI